MRKNREPNSHLFEQLVHSLETPVLFVDRDRCVQFMNDAAGEWAGVKPDESIGRHLSEVLDVNDRVCESIIPETWMREAAPGEPWAETMAELRGPVCVHRRVMTQDAPSGLYALVFIIPARLEQRYRDILAGSSTLLFECQEEGRIVHGGRELAEALGRSPAQLETTTIFELVSETDRERLKRGWKEVLSGKPVQLRELGLLNQDGESQHYWLSLFPVSDRSGRATGVRVVAGDIRMQKGLAHALEAAEERFDVLFRESLDPMLILTREGEILTANQSFELFVGLPMADLFREGKGWEDFVHAGDVGNLVRSIRRCAEEERSERVETRMLNASGQATWFEQSLSVLHDEEGNARGVVMVARDIDRRKRREIALQEKARAMEERHQRAQVLIDKLKHFFMCASTLPSDMDGYFRGVCGILHRMYTPRLVLINIQHKKKRLYTMGYELSEDMRRAIQECPPSSLCGRVMESGVPLYLERVDETEPYRRQPVIEKLGVKSCLGAPLRDSKGVVRGVVELFDSERRSYGHEDVELITVTGLHLAARLRAEEQEEINRELADHLRQAQKMEAVGKLAGGMAHDFNNILGGILGFSSYLISKAEPGSPLHRDLGLIEQSALRASELTEQLLSFARRRHFAREPVLLNAVIEEVLALLEHSLPGKVVIRKELDEKLPAILGATGQLNQAIMNLCLNAADAMSEQGGTLTVRTECRPLTGRERATLINSGEGPYACVSVMDTGVGMDESVLEHIFEPFYTTKENAGGTGLGLSIVYGIIDNHGGHIVANSRKGVGSTFTLYFPVTP